MLQYLSTELNRGGRKSTGCLPILPRVRKYHKLVTTTIRRSAKIYQQLFFSLLTWLSSGFYVRGTHVFEESFRNLAQKVFPPLPTKLAGPLDTNRALTCN
jgi:hypothetical protein